MEIKIPLISYGKVELIEGDYETAILEKDFIRVIGRRVTEEPKDDDEYVKETRTSDYDIVVIKNHIIAICRWWDTEDGVDCVFVDTRARNIRFEFSTREESEKVHKQLLSWYFEGIVE